LDPRRPTSAQELRLEAEGRLEALPPAPESDVELSRLVHELQVHQIELELQNESLQAANARAEAAVQELAQLNAHLESLVAQRTAELTAALQAAEAATQVKSVFLANIGHELLTPLNGMIGMSQLALRAAVDPQQAGYIQKSQIAANTLHRLIRKILEFSQLDAGAVLLEEKNFSLAQVVADLLQDRRAAAASKGLSLLSRIDPALPDLVRGDPLRLDQMLGHLVDNAIAFSHRGQIVVAAHLQGHQGDEVSLRMEVVDQGIGISPCVEERLFRPFSQVDDSTTRSHSGSGLGLVTSRLIARLMKGDIGVTSESGKGATFWVTASLRRAAPG
jgi:two-component system, sensor histidine kinase and response regulator